MLNKLKSYLLSIIIYVAMTLVLYSGGINIATWQWWAVYVLLISFHIEISNAEFDRYFRKILESNEYIAELLEKSRKELELTRLSSATSMPADTNPHDAKPPSP